LSYVLKDIISLCTKICHRGAEGRRGREKEGKEIERGRKESERGRKESERGRKGRRVR
jgi:hypothetical protein